MLRDDGGGIGLFGGDGFTGFYFDYVGEHCSAIQIGLGNSVVKYIGPLLTNIQYFSRRIIPGGCTDRGSCGIGKRIIDIDICQVNGTVVFKYDGVEEGLSSVINRCGIDLFSNIKVCHLCGDVGFIWDDGDRTVGVYFCCIDNSRAARNICIDRNLTS